MSTRAIRVTTSVLIALCLLLGICWPFIMGGQPSASAETALKKAYAIRFVSYVSVLVLLLIGAAIGAILIMRRTVVEVREAQMDNMKELIETTLDAHKTKANDVE